MAMPKPSRSAMSAASAHKAASISARGTAAGAAAERETGTVVRVVMVLRAIADSDEAPTMKQLADAVNLPPSTMHRLLELLAAEHMVERDDATKTFRPGIEYFRLASRVVHRTPLASLAKPFLDRASREADESCYLGMYDSKAGKLVFVASAASQQMLDYRVPLNTPYSLVLGASGLSVLAWLDDARVDEIYAREKALERTQGDTALPTRKTLQQSLVDIRQRGYGNTFGQRIKEAVGFFAPVFDGDAAVRASFGFTVPQSRYVPRDGARLAGIVLRHAGGLSKALGYTGPYPRPPHGNDPS